MVTRLVAISANPMTGGKYFFHFQEHLIGYIESITIYLTRPCHLNKSNRSKSHAVNRFNYTEPTSATNESLTYRGWHRTKVGYGKCGTTFFEFSLPRQRGKTLKIWIHLESSAPQASLTSYGTYVDVYSCTIAVQAVGLGV